MTRPDFVYIVEDDSISCYLIKLELDGHSTFKESAVFKNGRVALDELAMNLNLVERLPDLILLDINMPVMDGWEFLNAFSLIEYSKKISVIILTSSINPEDVEKAKTYEVVKGFLSKPLTSAKLDQIIAMI